MNKMKDTIARILLKIAKDEQKDEKDRLKACEALIRLAQEEKADNRKEEEFRVIVEYGREASCPDETGEK